MKFFSNIVLGILCVTVLFLGNAHYQKKLANTVKSNNENLPVSLNLDKNQKELEIKKEDQVEVLAAASNWPDEWKKRLAVTLGEKRPFYTVILGSPAIGAGSNSWGERVKTELLSAFGEHVSVTIQTVETTSSEFLLSNEYQALKKNAPDLLLWEPFTLMDNGVVEIADSLANITEVLEVMKTSKPETYVALQPPNPIYQAVFYPKQVEALKKYSVDNSIVYFDHWTNWPDAQTDEILPYLSENRDIPSAQGAKLWADYLLDVLVAK